MLQQAATARRACPKDALACMSEVSLEGTQELMRCRDTGVILATGGIGLVRAAYSSGKPAYGVGPGNVPAYIEKTRRRAQGRARRDRRQDLRLRHAVLVRAVDRLRRGDPRPGRWPRCKKNGGYFLSEAEAAAVAQGGGHAAAAGQPRDRGPPGAVHRGEGRDQGPAGDPRPRRAPRRRRPRLPALDREALPGPGLLRGEGLARGLRARACELLRFGGTGHTLGIHSRTTRSSASSRSSKPVFRIVANTQTSMGATGYTTGLAPSMSLGCGAYAGNITSDNITPLHLINIKRLAHGTAARRGAGRPPPAGAPTAAARAAAPHGPALDFVCEDDVRRALREGRTLRAIAQGHRDPGRPGPGRGQRRPRDRRLEPPARDAVL